MLLILLVLAAFQTAQGKEQDVAAVSNAGVGALLAGRYDNSAQVAQGLNQATAENPAPPHVSVTIEPTQQADWQLWRVHMDVDANTILDAVWAMNITRRTFDQSLQLVPYTLHPSVQEGTVKASAFDQTQWLSLEACMLRGDFGKSRIVARSEGEPCVAEAMGLGGKRAFLPGWIEREGDWLHVQLIFHGIPLRVDAHRM